MQLSEEKFLEFFKRTLGLDVGSINSETILFSSGIIDSFALISLMTFVEDSENIRIAPSDVNLANFDSISRIMAFAERAHA